VKALLGYIAAFVLLTVAGCGHSYPPSLRLADSLMDSRPDSALAVLDAARGQTAGAPEAVRMRYQLLRHQAMNKAYVPFTTDSVMLVVADYYDRHGTANDRLLAHYLLGCVYRDLGEAPQALQCFQDAVELADTTNRDNLRMLMSVYGQMAELYDLQNLPQDEIIVAENYGHCAMLLGDTLLYIRNMELMLKPYYLIGDTNQVLEIVRQARLLYLELGHPDKAASALCTPIDIHIKRGQLQTAHLMMKEFENSSGLFDVKGNIAEGREIYYYIKGNYFLHLHQPDSAPILQTCNSQFCWGV
jgi:tetratricopeptide (TPR) repeat protein